MYRYRNFFDALADCRARASQDWYCHSAGLMLLRLLDGYSEGDPPVSRLEIEALNQSLDQIHDAELKLILSSGRDRLLKTLTPDVAADGDAHQHILTPFLAYAEWLEESAVSFLSEDVRDTIERAQTKDGARVRRPELELKLDPNMVSE